MKVCRMMMKRILPVLLLASSLAGWAATKREDRELNRGMRWGSRVDSLAIEYAKKLDLLVSERNSALLSPGAAVRPDVYSLRMTLPPTFYSSTVLQQFSAAPVSGSRDAKIMRMYLLDAAFARMYANNAALVVQTDEQVQQAGILRDDLHTSLTTGAKLADKVITVDLEADADGQVELFTHRPNFWTTSGSGSLQFTQSYFSDNWYKGGENNYSVLGLITLRANYDNKQTMQWENTLEVRLGFQTTGESDTYHSMKPTENLLRLTTKLGYKAFKTFYYTTQVQGTTQLVSLYEANSNTLKTNFLSPLDVAVSVGMDYKFATKNNKFSGNVYVAPCTYNLRYVRNLDLVGRYGLEEGEHTKSTIGSSITVNAKWQIAKNISWNARVYWISNYSYTNIEWENTFNFSINKYLSAQLFVYPKFDDSSPSYEGDHGFIMMTERLSLGLNYSW